MRRVLSSVCLALVLGACGIKGAPRPPEPPPTEARPPPPPDVERGPLEPSGPSITPAPDGGAIVPGTETP